MHFEKSGPEASEQVLLLHGWGSSAELMRPIAKALDDRYSVVNADLPGHGRTPPPASAYGVPEFAAAVAELIRSEMKPPITLVGHSNGGRIGLFMASNDQHRDLIKRLVLISPSGMTPTRSTKVKLKRALAATLKAPFALLPGSLGDKGRAWLRGTAIWRSLGSSDYRSLNGVMRETFVKTVSTHLDDVVSRINAPTLVFWGTSDTDVKQDEIERLVDRIPDAGLVKLDGAGHYGYIDAPSKVNAGSIHFIENT